MGSVAEKHSVTEPALLAAQSPADSLQYDAAKMNHILARNSLSARLTVEGRSIDVGQRLQNGVPAVEFVFQSTAIFRELMGNLRLYTFAKAYFDIEVDIIGSFQGAVDVLYAINLATDQPQTLRERVHSLFFRALKATVPFVARRFESDAHYAMSDRAYSLFLDRYMQYTCAKFISGREDLNVAQTNKFELIRALAERHLRTLANIKHLDIGCGWGGLIWYFQKYFNTKSTGNTNSTSQRDYAISNFGAQVKFGDFSVLQDSPERYGLITIVGMLEHLTAHRRAQLLHIAKGLLAPNGVVYVQCIGKPNVWIGGDSYRIAYEDVFPGHQVETRGEMEARFRAAGFDILYAADDAADYAKTTALWVENLQKN
jgi:cyclopropane-fatty-acyl-phospholipid synthase